MKKDELNQKLQRIMEGGSSRKGDELTHKLNAIMKPEQVRPEPKFGSKKEI